MAEAPLPGSAFTSDAALALLASAYHSGSDAELAMMSVPPLVSSDDDFEVTTSSLISSEEENTDPRLAESSLWQPAASYLSADVLAIAALAVLPSGQTVHARLEIQRVYDAAAARLALDHHCSVARRHRILTARANRAGESMARAARAAADAVAAAVTDAQTQAAFKLQNERCHVTVVSRRDGKCRSFWRSCPVVAHAQIRQSVGLPHRDPVPCERHPRIIRASCCVCMRRRRLALLFSLHEPL